MNSNNQLIIDTIILILIFIGGFGIGTGVATVTISNEQIENAVQLCEKNEGIHSIDKKSVTCQNTATFNISVKRTATP